MQTPTPNTLTAFAGFARIATGTRPEVLARLRETPPSDDVLLRVFDDATGHRVDLDLRPDAADIAAGAQVCEESIEESPGASPPVCAPRGVGRPKLGVVAREVTLLPRHWEWLAQQRGGASVALRRLVDEARHATESAEIRRLAREAAYRVMSDMAGDLAGFEEATRALFADDRARFAALIDPWPHDLRSYLTQLAATAWNTA